MKMLDRVSGAFKVAGRRIARVNRAFRRGARSKKKEVKNTRPEIVVVRQSSPLRRKQSMDDLRRESRQASVVRHGSASLRLPEANTPDDFSESVSFEAPIIAQEVTITPVRPRVRPSTALRRSIEQQRRRGLVIDADIAAAEDEIDTAVSPTNIRRPFTEPQEAVDNTAGRWSSNENPFNANETPPDHGRRVTARSQSCMESQERFDSYIDAIDNEEAKRCSLHAILSTDIARLVAELDVLHNRMAMASMRAAYKRRSTLDATSGRPESWSGGFRTDGYRCSCGLQKQEAAEEIKTAKRKTWHAGTSQRGVSPASETRQEVILRHSAGTNLFRMSLYEGQTRRSVSVDQSEKPSPPRLELAKSFDFKRECERLARRIRPTFSVRRA